MSQPEQTVLVVDDETSILTLVEFNLQKAGFRVLKSTDGKEALRLIDEEGPDLIVLDVMLPSLDGYEICRQLRGRGNRTPIMMLTAKDEELDKVLGLELGADDYLTKPFSPRELVARVKALFRRIPQSAGNGANGPQMVEVGELFVNLEEYKVYLRGEPLELTPKEFEILRFMLLNRSKVVTREQLLNAVWHYDFAGDTRIVDVHVSHLRDKIEKDPRRPDYIKTVRGLGYKFEGLTG